MSPTINNNNNNNSNHHHHHHHHISMNQLPDPNKSLTERRASYSLGRLQGRESLLASTISIFIDKHHPHIPDGGWGWLVVVAAFVINLVSDGITCSFGILYVDFLNEFEASKSATAWIGSLYVAIPLVGGPIGSILVDKYGCKKMTIVGALISMFGFILSTYSRNIYTMYLTFGLLGGSGLALCYVTAVVAVAFWFDKKRTLALGLAAAGCGFGTVIYSPLITLLSQKYGWRGTVLILAGLFGNMCVCGLLQRDPDWILKQERDRLEKDATNLSMSDLEKHLDSSSQPEHHSRYYSVTNLPTFDAEIPHNARRRSTTDKHQALPLIKSEKHHLSSSHLVHGYLANIKESENASVELEILKPGPTIGSCPNIPEDKSYKNVKKTDEQEKKWFENFQEAFSQMLDISLFLQLHFFLVSIATILMCIWFAVPFVYLADHLKLIGYTDYQISLTISVLGVTNVFGMVIIGYLGTKIAVATLYASCLCLSGISCAAMMLFSSNYLILMVSSGAFGLFYASQHSLTPAIIAELVPLEKFSMAYGLSLLCQGIGKLTGPPLAGYLFDITQSYSQSFYQAAVWIIVAGILLAIIPFTKDRKIYGG